MRDLARNIEMYLARNIYTYRDVARRRRQITGGPREFQFALEYSAVAGVQIAPECDRLAAAIMLGNDGSEQSGGAPKHASPHLRGDQAVALQAGADA